MSAPPLRLLAQEADDLEIISAAVQDAVLRVGDIRWDSRGRSLTLALNRYRWEAESEGPSGQAQRVRSGLQLGGVTTVKARNLRRDAVDAVLELLAVSFQAGDAPGGVVHFAFADGGDLAVEVECIDAALADLSAPWKTARKPGHES